MGWFVRERRGVSWKEQTLESVAAPPLPLVVFLGLFIMLLYFATYSEYKEKVERSKMGLKLGLFLLPVVGVVVVNLSMFHRRWWRNTFPTYQAAAVEGSSPWGLLLVLGLLLLMLHYQSSFHSWFRSF
ncbi:uncharacterized protein LOC131011086 [Salvia miltiorrhiza]|uniref:uncharacterized protein LOC131011086 n=1 Tax=Salvia miltiorrhiza TaxID=226208 RepID=UPI0025AC3CC5|nr:uncharacterized protein LOC131011086 [Salvia miltiorrhiza]